MGRRREMWRWGLTARACEPPSHHMTADVIVCVLPYCRVYAPAPRLLCPKHRESEGEAGGGIGIRRGTRTVPRQ